MTSDSEVEINYLDDADDHLEEEEEETQIRFHRKYSSKIRQYYSKKAKQIMNEEQIYYKGKMIADLSSFALEAGIPRSTMEGWAAKSWELSKVKVSDCLIDNTYHFRSVFPKGGPNLSSPKSSKKTWQSG